MMWFSIKKKAVPTAIQKPVLMDSNRLKKDKRLAAKYKREKALMSGEGTIVFQPPKEARTIADVVPGKIGKVSCEGVCWRARCESDVAIAAGETAWVIARHTPTLTLVVVPAG